MYKQRFPIAGQCFGAFTAFGGLRAQLNLIAIVLNLCVTDSVCFGRTYFEILSSRLEESARMHISAPNEFPSLLGIGQLGLKEQARRELSLQIRTSTPRNLPNPTQFPRTQVDQRPTLRQRTEKRPQILRAEKHKIRELVTLLTQTNRKGAPKNPG